MLDIFWSIMSGVGYVTTLGTLFLFLSWAKEKREEELKRKIKEEVEEAAWAQIKRGNFYSQYCKGGY